MPEISRILSALSRTSGQPAVLATLVKVEGSSYRRPGARLLLLSDGSRVGSISGGCLEEDIQERALRVFQSGEPTFVAYDTTAENDHAWGLGLGCEGIVSLLLELIPAVRPRWVDILRANQALRADTSLVVEYGGPAPRGTHLLDEIPTVGEIFKDDIPAPPSLIVFGAGNDAQPLVFMAKECGWHVTVADSRAAYATPARFPGADAVVVAPIDQIVSRLKITKRSFAVIMTHRYQDDLQLLRSLFVSGQELCYLGQLGPRKRTDRLLEELAAEGLDPSAGQRINFYAPVGLDIGAGTSEAIAVAILAELHAVMAGRKGGSLREKEGVIHG